MQALLLAVVLSADGEFCGEKPTKKPPASVGRPSKGRLEGGAALADSDGARVLPRRHAARCLNFGVPRLVEALAHAGRVVQARHPGTPALGVGDLSRARGGPIPPYSRSHQAGRDADLAFYAVDAEGRPVAVDDLWRARGGKSADGALAFDAARSWTLVVALLSDPSLEVRWLFVSAELKGLLLAQAAKEKAEPALVRRATAALHQPSDAPPHDDHFHLRIRCTADERAGGCVD